MAKSDLKRINEIIKHTLSVIENSRGAIMEIADNARKEVAALKEEIFALQLEVQEVIKNSERLEKLMIKSRIKLATISGD